MYLSGVPGRNLLLFPRSEKNRRHILLYALWKEAWPSAPDFPADTVRYFRPSIRNPLLPFPQPSENPLPARPFPPPPTRSGPACNRLFSVPQSGRRKDTDAIAEGTKQRSEQSSA